jgi:outer membrane protein TolC
MSPRFRLTIGSLLVLILGGCATFSEDGGRDAVNRSLHERGVQHNMSWIRDEKDAAQVRERITALMGKPLTADTATEIALLNNRGLQSRYAELGIAEADLVQAGRLRNPGFSFGRLHRADEVEYERAFMFDLLGLLTMPLRTQIERERFVLAQGGTAAEILQVAADTRRAWFRAVAAQQSAQYAEQVKNAAEATAELARRMAGVGNFSTLDRAREQAFFADATTQLARARQQALAERERLSRLMGLWGGDLAFRLPDRLPDLPKSLSGMPDIEQRAMQKRLDVQGAMMAADNLANVLGLTKVTGWFSLLEGKYLRSAESGKPRKTGYEIELRLPIFDFGTARVARAEYSYLRAVNQAADLAVRARSEVREAYGSWRTAWDIARHQRDEVVPLRARISEETLLRYNGMLMSVFELLAESRQQINAVISAIEAERDFWLADATLHLAINGKSPGLIASTGAGLRAATPAAEAGH